MKDSKEIDSKEKAKNFLDDYIKMFDGIDSYDDGIKGNPIDVDFLTAMMAGFMESETKQLREENERLVESNHMMSKLIADHVDRGDRIQELEEGMETWLTKTSGISVRDYPDIKECRIMTKSLLTKDTPTGHSRMD